MRTMSSPAETAAAFLQQVNPTGPWSVASLPPEGGGIRGEHFAGIKQVRAWVESKQGKENCYFISHPTRKPSGKAGRTIKTDATELRFLHADYDLDKLTETDAWFELSLSERKKACAEHLQKLELPGPPTFIVDTGGGVQALWQLAEPLANTPENREWVEGYNRTLTAAAPGGDEACWDVCHLLRLPGTTNLPNAKKRARGREPVEARLVSSGGRAYEWFDIEQTIDPTPPKVPKAEVNIVIAAPEYTEGDEPLRALIDTYEIPGWVAEVIRDGRADRAKSGDNSFSAWMFKAVLQLVRLEIPNEVILGLLVDPHWGISTHILKDEGRHGDEAKQLAYAERQIVQAHAAIKAEDDKRQQSVAEDFAEPVDLRAFGDAECPASESAASRAASRLRARSLTDLIDLPEPVWLIEGLLPETGTGTLYGAPYAGKTFCALDMGLHIATGRDYHGLRVNRGAVVHVAAEGSPARIRDRVLAWCARYGVEPSSLDGWWSLVDVPVRLDDSEHVKQWLKANLDADGNFKRALVVFDTQARNMIGDENSAKDISKMVAGVDAIRDVTGGFALRLHHEGRESKAGGRGSTAGAGADDVTLHLKVIEKNKRVALETEALRDGESGQRLLFDMTQQQFMHKGETRASLVYSAMPQGSLDRLLVRLYEERPVVVKDLVGNEEGFSSPNTYKLIDKAREHSWVEAGSLALTPEGEQRAQSLGAREPAQADFEGQAAM